MQDLIQKLEQTLELIKAFLELEKEQPVTPYASPQELKDQLDLEIGQRGIDNDTFFAILKEVMVATPKTASDSFFNQLFGGRNTPALVGEILASVLNNSMYTFKVAGPHVLIEKEVIAKMLEKVDYRNGTGTLTPGGSVSNMIAMMVARNEKDTQVRNAGLGGQKMIAYTSEEGHYSTRKNAGILGLGRDQVRMIKSDALGKMDVQDLEENIQADLELGHIPFFINSTAGTTVLGAFDPFEEIALIAQKYQAWFHIDGALGGTVVLSRKYRHLVKGAEYSDSFTWNAHKMMGVPLTASAILFNKDPQMLRRHFSEKADYLFQGEDDFNPGEYSLQCGRRNDGLKIWAAWKYLGDEGYEARVNQQYELTQYAVKYIQADQDLHLLQEPECITVCFEVANASSQEICNRLNQEGRIKVGYGKVKNKRYIRLVCVDAEMQTQDIDHFFEEVKLVANTLTN